MCASHHDSDGHDDWIDVPLEQRSMASGWHNIIQPGSTRWKAQRWAANMMRRITHRSSCCGHPGEPGC
jgi:hypothetical protein